MALQLYKPLDRDGSIRLIEFVPTDDQDTISISMKVVRLGTVSYVALSYVWGDTRSTRDISCNGIAMKIPPNLFSALQRLRKRSSIMPIWVDAICICQEDITERGWQVALMGKIYGQAREVLVYISDFQEEPSEVVALVQEVKAFIQNSGGPDNMTGLLDEDPLLLDPRWKSVARFRQAVWFSRAWVIQEVGMAREAYILYGDCEFSYRDWCMVEVWAHKYAPQLVHLWNLSIGTIHPAALDWFQEESSRHSTFLKLVGGLSWLQCTDPRDHIYSLLAHPLARLKGGEGRIIVPDYYKPVEDVFKDFTLQCLKLPEGLRLLSIVEHGEKGPQAGEPSWMPFSHLFSYTSMQHKHVLGSFHLHYYNASAGLGDSYFSLINGEALHLDGIYLDEVAAVFRLHNEDFEIDPRASEGPQVLESIYQAAIAPGSPSPYTTLQERRDAFSISLSAGFLGRINGERIENLPSHRADFDAYWNARKRARDPSTHAPAVDIEDEGNAIRIMVDMKLWTLHHCFFITKKGYVGLGPYFARPGDVCIVVRGGFVPFVIRRDEPGGRYRLVEECYVHGIMRGELASMVEKGSFRLEEIILH